MAEKRIANELEVFQRDIRTCRFLQTKLKNTYQGVFDEINALSAAWSGGAHDVLHEEFQNDAENMKQLLEFLEKFLQELENAKDKYQQCESNVSETIRAIKV